MAADKSVSGRQNWILRISLKPDEYHGQKDRDQRHPTKATEKRQDCSSGRLRMGRMTGHQRDRPRATRPLASIRAAEDKPASRALSSSSAASMPPP